MIEPIEETERKIRVFLGKSGWTKIIDAILKKYIRDWKKEEKQVGMHPRLLRTYLQLGEKYVKKDFYDILVHQILNDLPLESIERIGIKDKETDGQIAESISFYLERGDIIFLALVAEYLYRAMEKEKIDFLGNSIKKDESSQEEKEVLLLRYMAKDGELLKMTSRSMADAMESTLEFITSSDWIEPQAKEELKKYLIEELENDTYSMIISIFAKKFSINDLRALGKETEEGRIANLKLFSCTVLTFQKLSDIMTECLVRFAKRNGDYDEEEENDEDSHF